MTTDKPDTPVAARLENTDGMPSQKSGDALFQQAKPNNMHAEIKKVWSRLTDEEVRLHTTQPEQFFAKIKEKYGTERAETKERLAAIKTSCSSCTTDKTS